MGDQLPAGFVPDAAPAREEDADLAFLKPGYKRPAALPAGFVPDEETAPAAPDKIGAANQTFRENLDAIQHPAAPAPAEPQPDVSGRQAFTTGAVQGASLGWSDELAARADTLISKVPGVRTLAEKTAGFGGGRGGSLDYTNPDLTYEQRRDAYRAYLNAANEQHPYATGAGEIAGGIATAALAPGAAADAELEAAAARAGLPAAAKVGATGLRALETGVQGAALGGVSAAGASEGTTPQEILKDTAEGAALGGAGGVVAHTLADKVVRPVVQKAAEAIAPKLQALADRQAFKALTRKAGKAGAPDSLVQALKDDPNLPAAINEPIDTGAGKTTTLAKLAGKEAEDVRPVLQAGQEKVNAGLESAFHTADAGSGGGAKLSGLANHYDTEIGARSKTPNNEHHIRALEGAQADALASWGPKEEQIQQRLGELNGQTDKIYAGSDEKAPVRLGDLVDHYNAQIEEAKKSPGMEPVVGALEKARDSAINAWGAKKVFDPETLVTIAGDTKPQKAGTAIKTLEAMAKRNPEFQAQADAVRAAATKSVEGGYDPEAQIAAKDVRKYATLLQNEGETATQDPKLAAKARQMMGSTTKDFVNQHVEKTMGPADRKALEALNQRKTDLLRWPDVIAGKNTDPALRNRVLNEFDTRVSSSDLDKFANQLENQGAARMRINSLTKPNLASEAKENLGTSTRDFMKKHIAASASPEDAAQYERLLAHRKSLENIDEVLKRRELKESQGKSSGAAIAAKTVGHGVGLMQLAPAVHAAMAGDVGGALAHGAAAVGSAALPHVAPMVGGAGRAAVRGAARAADYIAKITAAADAGNPWAMRQVALLRQSPGGAARLAAAAAMNKPGGGTTP